MTTATGRWLSSHRDWTISGKYILQCAINGFDFFAADGSLKTQTYWFCQDLVYHFDDLIRGYMALMVTTSQEGSTEWGNIPNAIIYIINCLLLSDSPITNCGLRISAYCYWVRVNKLSLNIEKTNFMLFTPKGFSRNIDHISIDGQRIEEVRHTKFLGVILDNKLNWHAHCEYICGKMSKGISIIIKARKVFNEATLLSLYNSLILPYLSYCIHMTRT